MSAYDICLVSAKSDSAAAERLAGSIRRYRLPAGVVLQPDTDYRKVITDTQETAFDEQVREQLDKSRFMVFLCSSDAKNSEVLNERLDYFCSTHDREHVIAVLVRDEPSEALPDSFIEKKVVRHILPDQRVIERLETIEPIAADLRAESPQRLNQLLSYETVRIVASVLELHPDDLQQRQRARRRKTLVRMLSLAAAVILILSGIFLYLGLTAHREGVTAAAQTRLSAQTAQRTMNELPALFADEPLAQSYIEEAISSAREALAEIGMEDLLDEAESGGEQ